MRKFKKALVAIATASVLATATLGLTGNFFAASADVSLDVEYQTSYAYGDSLAIGSGNISVDGTTVQAEATVLLPDGSTSSAGRIKLNQEGVYKVEYSATVNGKTETVVRSFSVKKPLFGVSSTASSVTENVTYNAEEHEKEGLQNVNGYQIEGKGSVSGVMVSLASGDYFTYNQVIDLNGKTKDDALIEFSITPETIGIKDVEGFDLILTDAYDSSSQVIVRVMSSKGVVPPNDAGDKRLGLYNGVGYLRASVGGEYAGMYWSQPGVGEIVKEEGTGSIVYLDFSGVGGESQLYNQPTGAHADISSIDKNCFCISYDDLTKQLFPKKNGYYATGANAMVDLDDENYFETPWKGFTTGECFLSIRGFSYVQSSFNFVVKEVDGTAVSDVKDQRKPHAITVDTLDYDESSLPNAVVGYPYPVYQASCVSPYYGDIPVSVCVYEGTAESGTKLDVTDGKFQVSSAGEYTIVYSATDNFDVTVTKSLTITAAEDSSPLTVTLDDEKITSSYAGYSIKPAKATVANAIGGSEVTVWIEKNGKRYELTDGEFRFPCAGEYTVCYLAKDYVGRTATYSYEISVEAGNAAVFTDDVVLPRYFVEGYRYEIPALYAYNYTDGSKTQVKTTAYINDLNGETRISKGYVIPAVKKSGDVAVITYEAQLNGNVSSKSYEIPVLQIKSANGGYDMEKLFYTVSGSASYEVQEYETVMTVKEDATVEYINPLLASGFEFLFAGNQRMTAYDSVSLILTDAANPNVSVKFTYAKKSGGTVFYVNEDGKQYEVSEGLTSGKEIKLAYKQAKKAVSFSSSSKINVAIEKTLDGEKFEGFPSGKVYASISVAGVSGSSKIQLKKLSNQAICDVSSVEYNDPIFGSAYDYGGIKAIGSTVKLPKILAVDAIEPWLELKLTVTAPDGKVVVAKDGTELKNADGSLEYEIALKKYGSYIVAYSTEDSSGNRASLTYLLTVIDDEAPVITMSGKVPAEGKVGEKIILPEATAKDKIDGEVSVNYYVITNQGQFVVLKDRAFVPQTAGEYTICVWSIDASGNMGSETYTVNVIK